MGSVGKEVADLRDSYAETQAAIEAFEDDVERDIGLGTLRMEARKILLRLRNSEPPPTEDEIKPLADYVATSKGGRTAEWTVKAVEKGSDKLVREVFDSLRDTILTGSAAGAIAFVIGVCLFVVDAGEAFLAALLPLGGGALWYFARTIEAGVSNGQRVMFESWDWACRLGHPTEQALAPSREAERRLLMKKGIGMGAGSEALAARARRAAQTVVIVTWIMVVSAVGLFGIGVWQGIEEATAPQSPPETELPL